MIIKGALFSCFLGFSQFQNFNKSLVFLASKRTKVLLCRTHCKVLGVTNGGFPFEIAKTDIVIIITMDWTKYDVK